ncbi:MAG: hypothetical protein MJ025_05195, partial [Victivallaceae bacterium]|nr:hypothetical protein [Victivallaceae bacterium]
MKKTTIMFASLAAMLSLGAAEFHVAPPDRAGEYPDVAATSVAGALEVARNHRARHPGEEITLVFHAGTYNLSET